MEYSSFHISKKYHCYFPLILLICCCKVAGDGVYLVMLCRFVLLGLQSSIQLILYLIAAFMPMGESGSCTYLPSLSLAGFLDLRQLHLSYTSYILQHIFLLCPVHWGESIVWKRKENHIFQATDNQIV